VPGIGLILERARKGRGEERALLTDVLPDRGLDVATAHRRHRSHRSRMKKEAEARTSGRRRSRSRSREIRGEPAGTRTQGPRLKSSKRLIVLMA
jgi:hypothetical protein